LNIDKWNILLDTLQQEFVRENIDFVDGYIKLLKKVAPPSEFPRLLDIGVGEGPKEVARLRSEGYRVTGITIQPWMLATDILLMDMHDQTFAPESFDVAYATQVFEHSYAPWLALMETWVTLKSKGILFISVPPAGDWPSVHHPSQFDVEAWRYMFNQTGFSVVLAGGAELGNETCVIIAGEKSEPPDPHVFDALKRLRGMRERG